MKNAIFLLLFTLSTILVKAQDYQINFTGSGLNTTVDSVQVRNLEQNTSITLLGTDILNLVQTLSLENPQGLNTDLYIYPNPLRDTGKIGFYSTRGEDITLEIYDVIGRTMVRQTGELRPGKNSFEISGFPSGSYIAKITTNTWQESIRFMSTGSNNQKPLIKQNSQVQVLPKTIVVANTSNNVIQMQYNNGEVLLLTAYSNDNIVVTSIVPTQSQTVNSEFVSCQDAAGTNYPVVVIGNQTWMAANLNYATSNSWCYDDNPANCTIYGRLYDWQDALTACPSGWHLPTDEEWTQLTDFLGGGGIGGVAGGKMKSTTGWNAPNTGATNSSGFSGLPGGARSSNGNFTNVGNYGYWWSSSEAFPNDPWIRYLFFANSYIDRAASNDDVYRSCRCLKD